MHLQVLRYGYNFVTSGRLVVSQIFREKRIFWELKKLQRIGAHASFCFVLNLVKGCVRKVQICTRTGSD